MTHPLHRPAGSARDGDDPLHIAPADAGWAHCGLRVVELAPGEARTLETEADEHAVLPLAGGAIVVEADGERIELIGRDDPFARVTDFAYLPRDCVARIVNRGSAPARLALPYANARRRLPVRYGPAEEVPVEVRGAGSATRQVNNFLHPDAFETDRLTCVELLTPEGNTSSYPPHKHDDDEPSGRGQAVLEEIYYFELRSPGGVGLHRTYTADGEIDATVEVGHGDAFLIPRGYHGPCVALPGYDLYYLNVLAGPAGARSLAFFDDPAHAWVRASWEGQPTDPRLPMADARGPVAPTAAPPLHR
ncbi:5-deoxy-glucuronate isomerase [Conexibacter arvalis]|uniref:5-deoxy-glucuronate isomerase n=1 Tax=Conexibacter arvalis TaxID=912552 RepID=A0A840IBB4_9ACTN|nr:5-deoxy-glucuronate isomerase [Conexibacter arvalis]